LLFVYLDSIYVSYLIYYHWSVREPVTLQKVWTQILLIFIINYIEFCSLSSWMPNPTAKSVEFILLTLLPLFTKLHFVRNRPATEPVTLKVRNIKFSFDIWLVLYMYFILYSWQYPPFKACGPHMEVIWIAAPKGYATCCGLRALTVLWGF